MLVFGTCLLGLLMQAPVAEAPADAWRAEKLVTVKPKAPAVEAPAETKPQPPAATPAKVKPAQVKKAAGAKGKRGARAGGRRPAEIREAAPIDETNGADGLTKAPVVGESGDEVLPEPAGAGETVASSGTVASAQASSVANETAGVGAREPPAGAAREPVNAQTSGSASETAKARQARAASAAEESASEGERCELGPVLTNSEVDPVRLRKGRAQMFAGAGLLGVGVVGLGVMVSGSYIQRFSAHELARGTGYSDEALAPLRAQHNRGETMLAAGAVTAAFGAVLGVTLLATGARDVRAARGRVQVAPTLGGLVLSGRF